MERFKCEKCGNIFENEGEVLEYTSPIYGPCSKKVSDCPDCGIRSDEYRSPKQAKAKPLSGQDPIPAMGGCSNGGGCCCSG